MKAAVSITTYSSFLESEPAAGKELATAAAAVAVPERMIMSGGATVKPPCEPPPCTGAVVSAPEAPSATEETSAILPTGEEQPAVAQPEPVATSIFWIL